MRIPPFQIKIMFLKQYSFQIEMVINYTNTSYNLRNSTPTKIFYIRCGSPTQLHANVTLQSISLCILHSVSRAGE